MNKVNYLLLLVFAVTLSISSCKKDESTPAKTLSTSEKEKLMLTAGSWKMTSYIEKEVAVVIPDCEKDDVYTFSPDGTYLHNVGTVICGGESNSSGTWGLTLDLMFTFDGAPMGIEITNSKLVLAKAFDIDGNTITEMTFVPI
jgi:Lipocalin-like domain